MSSSDRFKHVTSGSGKVESICMTCLLAIGIFSSEEQLAAKESQHQCKIQVGIPLDKTSPTN